VNHDLAAAFVPDDLPSTIDRRSLGVVMGARPLATWRDNVRSLFLLIAFFQAIELVFDSTRHRNRRSLAGWAL